jgi:hypothetical protein
MTMKVIVAVVLLFTIPASLFPIERVEDGYLLTREELQKTIVCDEERELLRDEVGRLTDELESREETIVFQRTLIGALVGFSVGLLAVFIGGSLL